MKKALFIVLMTMSFVFTFSQTTSFTPGWYIIENGNNYTVILAGGADYIKNEDGNVVEQSKSDLQMSSGEVVLAFEYSKGKVYCFDPLGRMVAFDNLALLTKAPIVVGCGVGLMTKEIQLIGGDEIKAGSYFWIIGQDLSKSTIKIQVAHNKVLEIPQDKISLLSATIKGLMKTEIFLPVLE